MLVRDIAPPIQRVIQDATEKTVRFYKRLSFWVKTSKYGAVTAAVLTSILAGSLTVVIASDKKTDNFYPTVLEANSWGNSWNSRTILNEIDLGQNADLSKFDHNNSLFINYIVPEEPEEETPTSTIDLEPTGTTTPESSPTENVVPGESTSSPETTPSEISTTTPTEEPQPPVEEIIPEPQPQEIIPPVEEPVETSPVEEPSVSFFQRFFGRFITNAQDDATTPLVPSEPVEGEPAPEPLVEETPPAETTPDANLPTVDGDVPIVEEPVPDTSTPPQTDATLTPDTPIDPVTETPYPTETAEEPNIVGIFNNSTELVAAKFAHQERIIDGETPIELITLKLSMAMAGVEGEDDAVLIEYRKHETDIWNQLQVITQNQEYSNKTNNGYFSYAIPIEEGENFRSFEELEVRVTHLSNNLEETRLPVLIDAIWFEVEYLDIVTEATFAEPLSNINTFKLDQTPEFKFEYKDPNGRWFENPLSFLTGKREQFNLKSHYIRERNGKDKPKGIETEVSYEDETKWTIKVSKPPEDINLGEYSIDIYMEEGGKIYKQTVKFYWGVLAINTHKSIYQPGDLAEFHLAVLDGEGHTVCGADLLLTITDPNGVTSTPYIDYSTKTCGNTVTNHPDYIAVQSVEATGTYEMGLERFDENGDHFYSVKDTFEVQESVPFVVERDAATRVWPWAKYTTTFYITANESFTGEIVETVPSSFLITEKFGPVAIEELPDWHDRTTRQGVRDDFTIGNLGEEIEDLRTAGDSKEIFWDVTLEEGKIYKLTYTFDPPDVTPELHLLGPLRIGQFEEARQWQMASDETLPTIYVAGDNQDNQGDGDESAVIENQTPANCNTVVCADSIDEDVSSPTDTNWVTNDQTETSATQGFQLNDMPTDFDTMATLDIKVRYRELNDGSGNDIVAVLAQIVQADGTTPLTDQVSLFAVGSPIGSPDCDPACAWTNDATTTLTNLDTTATSTVWDGAELELTWTYTKAAAADNEQAQISTLEMNGTYNAVVSATTTISGTTDLPDGTVVRFAINNTLDVASTTVSSGAWNITTSTLSSGDVITVWADNVGDASETTGVTKYDGTGDITGMVLNIHKLTLGSNDTSISLNITNLGQYDRSNDEDIMHSATTTTSINVDPDSSYTDEELVIALSTLAIGGSDTVITHDFEIATSGIVTATGTAGFTVEGSWFNNTGVAVFTAASSTVSFTATGTGETIEPGGDNFWNVTFNGSGGGWSFSSAGTLNNDMVVTAGTLSGTTNITVNGGDVTGNGVIAITGGLFTVNATGTFGGNTNWGFSSLRFGGGTAGTKTASGTGEITVISTLTISSSNVLDAFTKTWNLGAGFSVSGTFIASTSTVDYEATNTVTIASLTYYNLRSVPTSGSPVHTFATGNATVTNDFTVGNGTNAVTVIAKTNGPTLDVNGNFLVATNSTFAAARTSAFTIAGNFTNNGTFTNSTGTVTLDGSAGASVDIGSASSFYNLAISKTSSGTVTISTNTLDIDGNLTIGSTSILDVSNSNCGGSSCNIEVAEDWTNNGPTGSFVARTGTVRLDGGPTTAGAVIVEAGAEESTLEYTGRSIVKTSGSDLYAVIGVNPGGGTSTVTVWRSTDDGLTWAEQDSANNPTDSDGVYDGTGVAIDTNDDLHIAWIGGPAANGRQPMYVLFDTGTNTFGTATSADPGTSCPLPLTECTVSDITIDQGNQPHILFEELNDGNGERRLLYANKIGDGVWGIGSNPSAIVQNTTTSTIDGPSITINEDNVPELAFRVGNSLMVGLGNGNAATSFSTTTPVTGAATYDPSIAIDSGGNTWVGYRASSTNISLIKHNDADAWGTWQTAVTNSNVGSAPSIVASGTAIYVFYENDTDDISYDLYNGSWTGETVLETGTFQYVKARWQSLNNQSYNPDGIDYLFSDGNNVYWNTHLGVGESGGTQSINGNTTFYNLVATTTAARNLDFQVNSSTTIASGGSVYFEGASAQLLTLQSSSASTDWFFAIPAGSSRTVNYTTGIDANATDDSISATNSTCTRTTNWSCAVVGNVTASSTLATDTVVALAYDSTLQSATTSVTGGGLTFSSIPLPSSGQIVTMWADGVTEANESTAVTKYDGTGDITGMILNTNELNVGSDDTGVSLVVSDFNNYDRSNDEDIMHSATSTELAVDPDGSYTSEKIFIASSTTVTIGTTETLSTHDIQVATSSTLTATGGANFTISGSWQSNGTFTKASSTVTFTSTSAGETLTGTLNFASTTFNGSGGAWTLGGAFNASGTFWHATGTLVQAADDNILLTGNTVLFGPNATFTKASGSGLFIMDGVSNNQTFEDQHASPIDLGNVHIGQSPGVTKLKSDFAATSLTINTGDTLETHGWEVDIATFLTCSGTCILDLQDIAPNNEGNGTIITVGTNWTMSSSGTFTTATATVTFDETASGTIDSGGKPFYDVNIAKSSAATVSLTSNALDVDNDFTISASSTFDVSAAGCSSASCGLTIGGSYTNSATFTARSGTVTFDSNDAGETLSGTMSGSSAFWQLLFNDSSGSDASWQILNAASTTATTVNSFVIRNGIVTLGNGTGDNLEVRGGLRIASTTGDIATFQTKQDLTQGDEIVIDINNNASPADCANCIITVGTTSTIVSTGTLDIGKNVRLRLNPASASSDTGLEVEATGYLEINGEQITTATSGTGTSATKICTNSGTSWSTDQYNNMHVRITQSWTASTTFFGDIYEIATTTADDGDCTATSTADSITLKTNESATEIDTTVTAGNGDRWTITLNSQNLVTANNQHIGRYLQDLTGTTGFYKIMDSTSAASDTVTIILNYPDDPTSGLVSGDDVKIVDAMSVSTGTTFEILDYAKVQASSDTCAGATTFDAYIYGRTGSETYIRYSDMCDLGRNATNKSGITFNDVDAVDNEEGFLIDTSRIETNRVGAYITGSQDNNSNRTTYKGILGSYIYGGVDGIDLVSSSDNNTVSSTILLGNSSDGIYNDSGGYNTLSSNILLGNGNAGLELYTNSNVITSNVIPGNASHGIFTSINSNNTYASNTITGNGTNGIYFDSSSRNTLTSNTISGNGNRGIVLSSSSNNKFVGNSVYNNVTGAFIEASIGTIFVNDNYGGSGANTTEDIFFNSAPQTLAMYNTILASDNPDSINGVTSAGDYAVSFGHDDVSTTTKIWGEYTIPDDNAETPQNEALQKFNYASSTWEKSMTEATFASSTGNPTPDSDITQAFSGSWTGTSTAYTFRTICRDDAVADCDASSNDAWDVYRYDEFGRQTVSSTYGLTETFTDSDSGAQFTIGSGSSMTTGATYVFVAWDSSNSTDTQKDLQFMQNSDQLLVGSGETLEIKGNTSSCTTANQRTLVRRDTATSSGGYQIVATGTVDFQCSDFDYLGGTGQRAGIELNGSSTVTSLDNIALDNFFATSTASSSYVLAAEALIGSSQPSKTITGITLDSTGDDPSWNFNTKQDDGNNGYWKFEDWSGAFGGENYDGTEDGADGTPGRFQWGTQDISGTFHGEAESGGDPGQCDGSTGNLSIRVNGGTEATTTCTDVTGAFTFSLSPGAVVAGDTVTIYSTGVDKTNRVFVFGTTTTSKDIYENTVILADDQDGTFVMADIVDYDNSHNSTDMLYDATTTPSVTLTVDDGVELHILTGDAFTPGGTITTSPSSASSTNDGDVHIDGTGTLNMEANDLSVGGDFDNEGTFSASGSQTTTFTAIAAQHTVTSTSDSFRNVTFDGSGGSWSFTDTSTIALDLTVTTGTLDNAIGTANINVNGGDVSGAGTINLTSGTFTLDGNGSFGSDTGWNFANLTFGDGVTTENTTSTGTSDEGGMTVSSVLTISANQTLNAGAQFWYLTGSGTPFVITGSFNASTSLLSYRGTSATNVATTTYYDLYLNPLSGSPVYAIAAGTLNVNDDLTIGSGASTVTFDASTTNATVNVEDEFNINTNATYQAAGVNPLTVAGRFINFGGTFTHNNGTTTLDGSASSLLRNNSSFYNLNIAKTDVATISLLTNTLDIDNDLTIANGSTTLDVSTSSCSSASCAVTIGGSYSNSGTFMARTATTTFDSDDSGETLSGTMTGTSSFWSVIFDDTSGSDAAWTITDAMRVAATSSVSPYGLMINDGTVTLGDSDGDDLEILGGLLVALNTGNIGTFQTKQDLAQGDEIVIDVDSNSSPLGFAWAQIGAESGAASTGTIDIGKNVRVRLNPSATADTPLYNYARGYLEVQGTQDVTGTDDGVDASPVNARETKICDNTFTGDHTGKHVRISGTSSLAFGKIYTISATTDSDSECADAGDDSITFNDTATPAGTAVATTTSNTDLVDGSSRVCSTSTLISSNDDEIGRYVRDLTGTAGHYRIVDSINDDPSCTDTEDGLYIISSPDARSNLAANDNFKISDGLKTGDSYEILDYAIVQAESNTCAASNSDTGNGYIFAGIVSGSEYPETFIRYSDICDLGESAAANVGIYLSSNGSMSIEKSRIHDGYYGMSLDSNNRNNDNDEGSAGSGIRNNAIYNSVSEAIRMTGGDNNVFYGNDIYGAGDVNWSIIFRSGAQGHVFSNNIVHDNASFIHAQTSTNNNNLFVNNTFFGTAGQSAFNFWVAGQGQNTFINNTIFGLDWGFGWNDSDSVIQIGNDAFANNQNALSLSGTSTSLLAINERYGLTGKNTQGDIDFNATANNGFAYNTITSSTSEFENGPTISSSYWASYKHDNTTGTTKIWGEYVIPDNDTETPQDEGLEQYTYASSTWPNSQTQAVFTLGTGDTDISQAFSGSWSAASSVFAYRIVCRNDSTADCDTASNDAWDVSRYDEQGNQTVSSTYGATETYTDPDSGVQFTIATSTHQSGSTYTFTAWRGSGDTDTQKDLQFMQNSDQLLVGSGETLEIKGNTSSCTTANQRTLVRRDTALSTGGYQLVATGTVDFQCSDFDYLGGTGQKGGIELNGSSTVASLNNIALDNFFATSTANSSYVLVDEDLIGSSQPSKTIDGIALESSGDDPSWNFNTKEDDGGLTGYWLFTNATGTFSGESFDGDNDAADADPGRFNWQSGVTISGIFYQSNESTPDPGQCNGSTQNLTLLVNGASSSTTDCDTGTGAFSFTNISATAGDTITIFSTGADKANTVFVSDANATSADLYEDTVIVRDDQDGTVTNSDLLDFDNDQNPTDLLFDAEAASFTATDTTELHVWTGDTFTPGGTITTSPSSAVATNDGDVHIGSSAVLNMEANALSVGGDFDNEGTFSASGSQTTTFTASEFSNAYHISPGGNSFRNVTFNGGVLTEWSFTATGTIDLDLVVDSGFLNNATGTANIIVNGGDITGGGIINLTANTLTLNATGSLGSVQGWTFNNLRLGADTPGTTSGVGVGAMTVSSVLTNSSSHVFNASPSGVVKIWNLTATGTPFVNSGTFTAASSTFDYEGAGSTTITAATYNNLRSQPTSGSPTHYLGSVAGQTFAINSDLTIGDGTNAVTLDANTRDPILDIASDFVLSSNGTFLASNSGVFTIAEDFTDNGTFTHNSGTVIFDGSATSTFSGSGTPVTTFSSFTSATDNKVLEFATGTTWQINATFTIDGSSGNEIKIQSNSSGTQWFINHQGTENITYASVLDGGCASTSTNITVQSSINRGNNDFCWLFPSLAFSLDSVSKSLNLTSANTFTATATSILTVTSTSEFGYDVTAYQTDNLRHTAYSTIIIANWPGTNAAPTVWTDTCQGNSDCGWGYNTNDTDLGQFVATEYAAFVTSTPGDVVARSTIAISGDVTTITYRSSVSATQTAGQYQTTIIYIVTPEF